MRARVLSAAHAAGLLPVLARVLERVAQAALDLVVGVDHLLDGHLVLRPGARVAAHSRVHAPAVLADTDVVDLFGALVLDGRLHAGDQPHRAQVDVLVQGEADLEQDALLQDAGGHVRVPHGAQEHGVEALELLQRRNRAGLRRCAGSGRRRGRTGRGHGEAVAGGGGAEHLEALAHDLRAGAVAGENRDLVFHCQSVLSRGRRRSGAPLGPPAPRYSAAARFFR